MGRACHLIEQAAPQCLLVQPLGVHEKETLPNEMEEIATASPVSFAMAAFEAQRAENLPQDETDVPMDIIVTEERVRRIRKGEAACD